MMGSPYAMMESDAMVYAQPYKVRKAQKLPAVSRPERLTDRALVALLHLVMLSLLALLMPPRVLPSCAPGTLLTRAKPLYVLSADPC